MEKVDPDWVESGNRHFVSYSELKPGKYTFKILASNSDGYWVKDVRTIHITILPPWWRTWWFRLMLFVIISLVIYYIYKARISYLENRQEELEAIVKVRTKELSESNEVLQEQAARIEEQSEELRITNEQLLYRQEVIEGQSNELKIFSNNIKEANDLLIERQKTIEDQSLLLKTSNKELLILNSTKDKFFSIIAHDLRNPFNTIMGFSEVLVSKYNSIPEEKVIKYLDLINASAIHANNLLENQLQWSRSQTDRISFEPVKTKLCALVMETMYLSEGAMLKKNITSSVQVPEELEVFADENMLKTVLRNLISNAIKFTDNGTITIAANNSNEATEIRISDTGVGISEEHLSKLFHIATNISTLGTNNEVGTGLGLILCYEFISKHAGSITVESKIGEGTTFMVKLPLKR
jgi:signal transduction histidine kinase